MTARAYIVGAGGFGRELHDWLKQSTRFEFGGFLDDGNPDMTKLQRIGARHVGRTDDLATIDGVYYLGIGMPHFRQQLVEKANALGAVAGPPIVHPTALLGSDVRVGDGSVVCPGAVVTANIRLGRHVHLHVNSTVGHDAILLDCVSVNPGATVGGSVVLEDGVMVGTNAAVNQGLRIGARSVVGSGAAVVKDIPPDSVAVGVPARPRSRGA